MHGRSKRSGWLGYDPTIFFADQTCTLRALWIHVKSHIWELVSWAVSENGCPSSTNFIDKRQRSASIFSHFGLLDGHSFTAMKSVLPAPARQPNTFLPDCYTCAQLNSYNYIRGIWDTIISSFSRSRPALLPSFDCSTCILPATSDGKLGGGLRPRLYSISSDSTWIRILLAKYNAAKKRSPNNFYFCCRSMYIKNL